jgi:hypothetical protein
MRNIVPPRETITPDTPLRLSVAAAMAYPDGTMTAAGLRREGLKGRLVIERTAGKDYTTLANIKRMRELCRVPERVSDSGCAEYDGAPMAGSLTMQSGSSVTDNIKKAHTAALMIVEELSGHSQPTSPKSISPKLR